MSAVLRRLLTPIGGAAALLICGLPWVRLECGTTRVEPTLWQLADQEWHLYIFPVIGAIIVILGVLYLVWQRRSLAAGNIVAGAAGIAAWVYVFLKRQEIGEKQVAAKGLGGHLGEWMQQIKIAPLPAFYVFLALMVLTIMLASGAMASRRDHPPRPGAGP